MKEKCSNCKAWKRDGVDGICRFYSPQPTIMMQGVGSMTMVWPRTGPDEYCIANFRPIEDEAA